MSKRGPGAGFGGDEARYGGYSEPTMDFEDKPTKATAAQLARRKIAQAKKPSGARSRGASPAFPPPAAASNGQLNQQPANFNTNFSFQFGQQDQSQNTAATTPSTFQFGASTPAPSSGQQQNGTPNMFGQSAAPSFGNTQPQQNSFGFGSSFGSTQPSQQQNNTSSFGGFGQNQQNTITPATTTSSTFGSFGKPQEQNNASTFGQSQQSGGFGGFGATQQKEQPSTTSAFGGAGMTQQAPTQNGFSFGQKPQESSKTTFGATGQQAQENSKPSTPNSFLGFGQKPQENGDRPSSIFANTGQKPQENGDKPTNIFANIGQKPQESSEKPSNPFAGFGQKPQENGAKPASNIFSGIGQKPAEETPKPPNPFAGFHVQQPNGTKEKTQEPSASIFSQPQQNGSKTPSGAQTPTTSTFNLGHNSLTGQQASKPATPSLFSTAAPAQSGQANGEPKGLFGSSLAPIEASKGNTSIFDSALKKDTGASKFVFSSSDPSQVYRPEDDPDNDEHGEEGTDSAAAPPPPPEPPKSGSGGLDATKPRSLFDRMEPADQAKLAPSSTVGPSQPSLFNSAAATTAPVASADPSTVSKPRSLFDRMEPADQAKVSSSNAQKPLFDKAPETPTTARPANLFAQQTTYTAPAAPSLFQPAQSSTESQTPKPPSPFQKPASQPSSSDLFTPAPTQPAAPSTALKAPATAPPARAVASPAKAKGPSVAAEGLSQQQQARLKSLNDGFLSHMMVQVREQDWTPILQYYMEQAANIRGVAPPLPPAATSAASNAQTTPSSVSLFSKPAPRKAPESATNIFSQLNKTSSTSTPPAQTSKQLDGGNIFKAPATAPPAAKKRPFQEEDDDEPAQAPPSEKRSKPNELFPKLPENASSAAKLFESSLGKANGATTSQPASTGGFNPTTKSLFSTSSAAETPSAPVSAPTFKPPTFAAPAAGNNFLSAFGKKADAESEKDRKKRKDEDYDSDEETQEEWEKRDREEQEAKRKKILEATKTAGGGFKFTASTTPAKPVTAKEVEKAQGSGDKSWKPETPIKFGASATDTSTTPAAKPPMFGFLSANSATPAALSGTEAGKLAPPTTGFSFGSKVASLDTSRATTPGVTTDGEASTAADADANAEGEADGEQKEAQIDADDMTALMPVEREENEVLMELNNVKTKKFDSQWVSKGDGRAYLLKNNETGKIRILQKVGLNQLALNFGPVKGMKYELHPKKNTMVVATFFDHIHSQPPKLDRFFITTEAPDEAKEVARILTEGSSQ